MKVTVRVTAERVIAVPNVGQVRPTVQLEATVDGTDLDFLNRTTDLLQTQAERMIDQHRVRMLDDIRKTTAESAAAKHRRDLESTIRHSTEELKRLDEQGPKALGFYDEDEEHPF